MPIGLLSVEDLRLMIGQEVGLEHLVPPALDRLEDQPLAEGDFYPGDLLAAVVRVPDGFWAHHRQLAPRALRVVQVGLAQLDPVVAEIGFLATLRSARDRLVAIA